MKSRPTAKGHHYLLVLVACVCVFGLTWRTELIFFVAPFAVALVAGLSRRKLPDITVSRDVAPRSAFENDPIRCTIEMHSETGVPLVEALDSLPRDAAIHNGSNHIVAHLAAAETRRFTFTFSVPTRRHVSLHRLRIRVFDRFGFYVGEMEVGPEVPIVIYPRVEALRSLVSPVHTQVYTGNFSSRHAGEGVEFAAVREMQAGDRLSAVNWRVTARRTKLVVNEYVVERNADVALLIDTFADSTVRTDDAVTRRKTGSLDLATRCAASVAYHYIRDKNRVGLVEFGHYLSWLYPSSGRRHWYRLLYQLSGLHAMPRSVILDISTVPKRILSSSTLVIGFTSLLSENFDAALIDLKQRGFDVAAMVVYAEPFGESPDDSESTAIARVVWRRERENRMVRLVRRGIIVAPWVPGDPIDSALREINASRARLR